MTLLETTLTPLSVRHSPMGASLSLFSLQRELTLQVFKRTKEHEPLLDELIETAEGCLQKYLNL